MTPVETIISGLKDIYFTCREEDKSGIYFAIQYAIKIQELEAVFIDRIKRAESSIAAENNAR